MSENISHSPHESAPAPKSIEQKGSDFSMLQDRLILGEIPWGSEILDKVLKLLPTLPAPVRSSIEKDLRWIGDNMTDMDVLARLQNNLKMANKQGDQEKIGVKAQEKEIDQKATEKDQKATEKDQKSIDSKEKNERAHNHIRALFDSFGGQDQFQRLNPELHTWQERAKKEILRDKPALAQDPELEQKALLRAIHENRASIDKNAQSLAPELRSKYASESQKLFRNIESSLVELQVPHEKMDIPPLPRDVGGNPKVLFPDLKDGEPLTRTGSEFRHGDQVIDTANPPPRKFIEGEKGTRIESNIPAYEPPYENLQAQANCLGDLQKITQIPNFDGDISRAKQFRETTLASLNNTTKELQEKETLLKQENTDTQKNSPMIEKLHSEVDHLKAQQNKLTQTIAAFDQAMNELVKLKQEESKRVPDYQQQVAEKDAVTRENLRYFSSVGLSELGQAGIDQVISIINQHRQLHGDARIDLKNPLSEKDKSDILRALQVLMGGSEEDIFRSDEHGKVSLIEDGNTKERITSWLRQAGLVGTISEDPSVLIEEKMKGFGEGNR